ncbi:hypothetical protein POM88_051915 [Heracleum sosnowskyi]|uniref:Replication factor A C-terminal domain-containing protein n=1 Tax=Heracleum sosnowskyi TaxID=360622 RepID=A0AAD8LWU9_9APIA|nr:hypothetical protein POM88_051915 [Heracleum sosnowskyi]
MLQETGNVVLSSGDGTKTHCNIDCTTLNELKAAILATTGHTIEPLPPPTKSRLVGSAADALKEATIQDILDTNAPMGKVVIRLLCEATIIDVPRDDGWFYDSCISCPCGVRFDGKIFTCKSCAEPTKKQTEIHGQCWSAGQFRKNPPVVIQDKIGPEIPPLIKKVVGRKCLFEVKVTSYNKPWRDCYTVTRLSETAATATNNNIGIGNNDEPGTSKRQRIP